MMLERRSKLSSFATRLLAAGRTAFSREEARSALGTTSRGLLEAAQRLQSKGQLLNPRRGFYVIVPPQFLSWGAPPPSWYIDDLMRHEGRPYYVGLLKAAELHGASHQAVMEFQVVTDKRLPEIPAGRSRIGFYFRKDFSAVAHAIEDHKTDAGKMKVSSVELTALDLLRYSQPSGGLDSIATILSDLGEKLDPEKLGSLAPAFERTVVQRLGYLLDRANYQDRSEPLHRHLMQSNQVPWIELEPHQGKSEFAPEPIERNERWHVIVRRQPEADE
jgi:predicted transcriptional regulator of viral defense system